MTASRKRQLLLVVVVVVCVGLGVFSALRTFCTSTPTKMGEMMEPPLPSAPQEAWSAVETRHWGDMAAGLPPEQVEARHRKRLAEYEALTKR